MAVVLIGVFSHLPVTHGAPLEGELIDTADNARLQPVDDSASVVTKKQGRTFLRLLNG
jgi:hypothetical protein